MYAVPMLLRVILGLRTDSDLWHTFYRYSCRRRCYETQYVFCSACVNGFMLLLNPPKNEGTIFVNTIAWPNFWHIPNSSRCPRYFRFWSAITFAQKLDSVSIIGSYIGWAISYGRCFGLFLFLFHHLGLIVIDCLSLSFPKNFNHLHRQIHIFRDIKIQSIHHA